jgi:SNF2 family DNA or RNA helicase
VIVLHVGILDEGLHVWGETPESTDVSDRVGNGRGRTAPKAFPFGASASGLIEALESATVGGSVRKREARSVVAWLPTQGRTPVASSPLVSEAPRSRAKVRVAPWAVTAYPLSSAQAVEFLCECAGKQTLAAGVVLAPGVVFWADALRFAGGLVARQQYLPGLSNNDGDWQAQWEPVFAGVDAGLLAELAKRMPASARALSGAGTDSPPETSAREALTHFIAGAVDHLVRSRMGVPSGHERTPKRRGRPSIKAASLHATWLQALRGPDGRLDGDGDWRNLASQIADWRRPISATAASPVRLCFRLEEPVENGEMWTVRYLLQPHDDPSLLVPVEEAWKTRGQGASQMSRYGLDVREYLLSSLGQAAGLCSRVAASLETAQPAHHELDTNGAHEFLTQRASVLEQTGFGVLLPAWWTRKGTKTRLAARAKVKSPRMQGGGGLSLQALAKFDWEVALDGKKLSLRELQSLAKAKAPLVKVRGQWVEMRAGEIRSAIEFWKQKTSGEATVRDILQMALGTAETNGGIEFEGIKATGWVGKLLKQLDGGAQFEELEAPKHFSGTLRPYQVRGYSWLAFLRQWGLGACLADDMGLGKTIQTLAQIERDRQEGLDRPVLLVCPTSVVNNWVKEAERFTPNLSVMVHHGIERRKGKAFVKEAEKQAVVVSSYALLHRDIKFLARVSWAGVVLDEAQNIKNPETKQARAARSIEADYRVALTGTPVENNVGDLWSIMEFLNPGFLGTQAEFKRRFFIPIQTAQGPEAAQRLKRLTGPFILRRLKTDKSIISDLPEKQEMNVFCSLTKEQASLYAAVLKEVEDDLSKSEGIQRKGLILATLSKLKQVCNHPAQFLGDNSSTEGRSGKLARLLEMLEEILAVGDRALVFTQFAEMGGILQRHLQETFGREVLFLHGGVTKKRRDQLVERFQEKGSGPPVFILSLKAGGTGLNLTGANHVFHFDRWWNPAVENQATDRAFRIGQTRNVQVHKFICAGTLEDRINDTIEHKKEIAENVVGTGEGWLTKMSDEDLKDLLALREGAVQE